MIEKAITLRLKVLNDDTVQLERLDSDLQLKDRFGYSGENYHRIDRLCDEARNGGLSTSQVKELGQLLCDALMGQKILNEFLDAYAEATDAKRLLRLELDIDPQTTAKANTLPWEFLYFKGNSNQGLIWLAADPNISFSRFSHLTREFPPIHLDVEEPLRIALAIAAPEDLGTVEYKPLLAQLMALARRERIQIIRRGPNAGRHDIDELLRTEPHIFHFIGHGGFNDSKKNPEARLALVNDKGHADWIGADEFANLFARHSKTVAILHCCNSGAKSAQDPLLGISSQLLRMKLPAVVAMQFPVTNDTAVTFSRQFYRHLTDGSPVDIAVQEGRLTIGHKTNYNDRDFATPLLFMNVPGGRVLKRNVDIDNREQWMRDHKNLADTYIQKGAFDDAHKVYKSVRDVDPGFPDIEKILKGLRKQISDQNYLKTKKEQFNSKFLDKSHKVYDSVIAELNRLIEKGEYNRGQKKLICFERFLNDQLSAEEFSSQWLAEIESAAQKKAPYFKALTQRFKIGELIPFLGSQFLSCWSSKLPFAEELRNHLAMEMDYPDFSGSLDMIAQYCINNGYSRRIILDMLQKQMDTVSRDCADNPFYEMIAEANRPMLVISASPDDFLETRLRQKNKPFAVLTHLLNPLEETDAGKIQIHYHDKDEPEPPCISEDLSRLRLLEKGTSIIYKIYGFINAFDHERRLLVENDFFLFARYLEQQIPPYIIRQFRNNTFLFLGYDLSYWQDRLVAYTFLEKKRKDPSSQFCAAVWEQPDKYQQDFWENRHVKLYPEKLPHFIHQFSSAWEDMQHGGRHAE